MYQSLASWQNGAHALALLHAALRRGYLHFLTDPRSATEVAQFAGYPADDLLTAFVAHGIVVRENDSYRLDPGLAAGLSPKTGVRLDAKIEGAVLTARQISEAVRTGSVSPDGTDSLVSARSVAFNPSDAARLAVGKVLNAVPEMRDAIAHGRLLDVGSGVGGFVLTAATLLHDMRATALEVVPQVAAAAVRRAQTLGVADRVDIRAVDARNFEAPARYDAAFWAQPLFPEPVRPAVLAMMLRNLRPGGVLLVQQLYAAPARDVDQGAYALLRLVNHAQGVPFDRPLLDLVQECEAAGFALVRTMQIDVGRLALFRRPATESHRHESV
ncbi:SAM-dependent methyltransferase [Actinoplanes sp. NPDC000266]